MGKDCKNMTCPHGQFCYHISNLCVDFLDCNRYNREKGQNPAESPLQCGPCIKGYEFETLANGQKPRSCKLVEMENSGESDTWNGIIPIVVIIMIVMALITALILCKRYGSSCSKRSICKFRLNDSASDIPKVTNTVIAVASAPLEEEKPFVGSAGKRCTPDNNNKRIVQTNEYQNTIPYSYRRIPSYTHGLNNSNNDSNSNDPNMLSRQVATLEIPENQHDRNTTQTSSQNDPSNNNDNLPNHDDDDSDTIDSASEPSNKNNTRPSNLIISQMVHQNIIINMNKDNN